MARIETALVIIIIALVAAGVWAGITAVRRAIGPVIRELGPATQCGARLAAAQRGFAAAGYSWCPSHVRAVAAAGRDCPPAGDPVYAQYLEAVGCKNRACHIK